MTDSAGNVQSWGWQGQEYSTGAEYDPAGADVSIMPEMVLNAPDDGNVGSLLGYPGAGVPAFLRESYTLDGMPVDADFAIQQMETGFAVRCQYGDCSPRWVSNRHDSTQSGHQMGGHYEFFTAVAGYGGYIMSGYMAAGAQLGLYSGQWFMQNNESIRGQLEADLNGFLPRRSHVELQKPPCPPVPEAPETAVRLGNKTLNLRVDVDAHIREVLDMWKNIQPNLETHTINDTTKAVTIALWFYSQVKKQGPWDYKWYDPVSISKKLRSKYEAFGNFVYGATGLAAGFTEGQLVRIAGAFQTDPTFAEGKNPGLFLSILGVRGTEPYGDEKNDNVEIRRGMEYYRRKFILKDCQ